MQKVDTSKQCRVSPWNIVVLSAVGSLSDMGYAIEGAYAIPVILASGIPLKYASLMLSLSPALGLIVQPFLGSATDQCRCSWGKRRPFILLIGLIAVISCGSIPYYFYIHLPSSQYFVPGCVVLCIMLFDLSNSALLIPTKAIMFDIVPPSQENTVNQISSASVGLLSCLGFGLGAVDWSSVTGKKQSIEAQSEIVFGITAGIFLLVILVTLFCIREKSSMTSAIAGGNINTTKFVTNYGSNDTYSDTDDYMVSSSNQKRCMICINPFTLLKNSVIENVRFCYYMSHHLWILSFTFIMAIAADFAFVYSFTIFFGMVVYGGDSKAPVDSDLYKRYTQGVRMGSLGLAIGNGMNVIVSLILEKLVKYVSIKSLFLHGVALFTCGTCLLMYFHQLPAALVICSVYGPYLGVCISVSYGLAANYKVRPQ